MEDISGKTVVITGASSGFGRGAALEFARLGANVVLAARRDDLLEEVARECRARSAGAWAVPTDVSRREDMENLARTALSEAGWIDVWINNAGIGAIGRFEDIPLDVHEQVLATNLLGTFYGSWVAWRAFLQRGRGSQANDGQEAHPRQHHADRCSRSMHPAARPGNTASSDSVSRAAEGASILGLQAISSADARDCTHTNHEPEPGTENREV